MNAPPGQQPPYPQQPYGPPYGQPPPMGPPPGAPPKKGMSGCLLAVLIVSGVFVLIGLVFGFIAWRFATSPDGKKLVSAVSSGAALVTEAASAPGTKELRTLGCGTALVLDAERMQELAAQFGDAGKISSNERLIVTCSATSSSSAPTCDQVAATYVSAVGRAVSGFAVTVDVSGDTRRGCTSRYSAEGKRIGH